MVKTSTVGVRGLAAIAVTLAAGVWGCGEPRVSFGGGTGGTGGGQVDDYCSRTSECAPSLVCSSNRCHEECVTSADCGPGQRCVAGGKGEGSEVRVCQLPGEARCGGTLACADGQLCAADSQCREACSSDAACPQGQRCSSSGVCAEPLEIDESGNLKIPGQGDPTPVGSSTKPTPGEGGAPSTGPDESGGAPTEPTSGGSSSTGGSSPGTGEGGGSSTSPSTEAGAGVGGQPSTQPTNPIVLHETCDDDDRGNGTRDKALRVSLNSKVQSCFQSSTDVEYFEFTVPELPLQGGYVVISATDVNFNGGVDMTVESAADDLPIRQWQGRTTEDVYGWFSVKPGTTYRAAVRPLATTGKIAYVFRARFAGVPDEYAPNQSSATATPIEVGDSIQAFTFAGYGTSEAPVATEFADWFAIKLEAGKLEARLDPAADIRGRITLYRSTGEWVTDTFQGNPGLTITLNKTKLVAGDYFLRVDNFSDPPPSAGDGPTPPAHATNPYTFTITQPL